MAMRDYVNNMGTGNGKLSGIHDLCEHKRIKVLCDHCTVDMLDRKENEKYLYARPEVNKLIDDLRMDNYLQSERLELCLLENKKLFCNERVLKALNLKLHEETIDLEQRLESMKYNYKEVYEELSTFKDMF